MGFIRDEGAQITLLKQIMVKIKVPNLTKLDDFLSKMVYSWVNNCVKLIRESQILEVWQALPVFTVILAKIPPPGPNTSSSRIPRGPIASGKAPLDELKSVLIHVGPFTLPCAIFQNYQHFSEV